MPLKSQLKTSVAGPGAPESLEPNEAAPPKTLSIPEAGRLYFGLSKNGSYDAAARGGLPFIRIGRLEARERRQDGANHGGRSRHRPSSAADRDADQAGRGARQAVKIPALHRHAASRPSTRTCRLIPFRPKGEAARLMPRAEAEI